LFKYFFFNGGAKIMMYHDSSIDFWPLANRKDLITQNTLGNLNKILK